MLNPFNPFVQIRRHPVELFIIHQTLVCQSRIPQPCRWRCSGDPPPPFKGDGARDHTVGISHLAKGTQGCSAEFNAGFEYLAALVLLEGALVREHAVQLAQ